MRVLVTGGAGFIGSHLVRACLRAGEEVRVLDDFSSGRRENLGEFADAVEWIQASVADPGACQRAVEGCEIVYHQAALPSVPLSVANPLLTHQVNAQGTLALLTASRDAGVRRLVYAASCAVYGLGSSEPLREQAPADPRSPYAVQKYAGELYCRQFAQLYGLETVVLRYFNVFGPRQDPGSPYAAVVPLFMRALRARRAPVIYGDGHQTRDFVYVEDVVSANRCAARGGPQSSGEVFNVGRGAEYSLLDLVDHIAGVLGLPPPKPEFAPPRKGDVRNSCADVSKIACALGWRARCELDDGLRALAAELG